ncbi:cellobiohydrolase ii [Moniliophthora roreri]|nr:cellobiohydrolase ii [Moniliophthora roreri]
MRQLNTAGVYMYLDAAHAGWLGWPDKIPPAAKLFQELWEGAGSPKATTPGPITGNNPNYDEVHYAEALAEALPPFPAHFLVDQGRSGQQNLRTAWGEWCNVKGAGLGTRPTTDTGSEVVDSIVWVKTPGESGSCFMPRMNILENSRNTFIDGTSDSSSDRFDENCVAATSHVPAPESLFKARH